jgi:hypothetical protein
MSWGIYQVFGKPEAEEAEQETKRVTKCGTKWKRQRQRWLFKNFDLGSNFS